MILEIAVTPRPDLDDFRRDGVCGASGDFDVTCPDLAILADLAEDPAAVVDFANDWAVLASAVFLACRRRFLGPCRCLLW